MFGSNVRNPFEWELTKKKIPHFLLSIQGTSSETRKASKVSRSHFVAHLLIVVKVFFECVVWFLIITKRSPRLYLICGRIFWCFKMRGLTIFLFTFDQRLYICNFLINFATLISVDLFWNCMWWMLLHVCNIQTKKTFVTKTLKIFLPFSNL